MEKKEDLNPEVNNEPEQPKSDHPQPEQEEETFEGIMEQIRRAATENMIDLYKHFKNFDINNTNQISNSNLSEGFQQLGLVLTEKAIKIIFEQLDPEQTMKLNIWDFTKKVEQISINSLKAVKTSDPLYPIYEKIRNFIKDKRGKSIHEIYSKEKLAFIEGKVFLSAQEFKNGFTVMKIHIDQNLFKALSSTLETTQKGKVDYLLFCERLGYIQANIKSDASVVPRPMTGGPSGRSQYVSPLLSMMSAANRASSPMMSRSTYLDVRQVKKEFFTVFSNIVFEKKMNLQNMFDEVDTIGRGDVAQAEFRRILERIMRGAAQLQFQPQHYNAIAENYPCQNKPGRVAYRNFISAVREFRRKFKIMTRIFSEFQKILIQAKIDDLYTLLQSKDTTKTKQLSSDELNKILEEYCDLHLPPSDLESLVKDFEGETKNRLDFLKFEAEYKEFVQKKEDEGQVVARDRHLIDRCLAVIKQFCDTNHVSLLEAFKDVRMADGKMTQFDFQNALKFIGEQQSLTEEEIFGISRELDNSEGKIEINYLCKLYNDKFNENMQDFNETQIRENKKTMLIKIADHLVLHNIPIERVFEEYVQSKEITKTHLQHILQHRLGLYGIISEKLTQFINCYNINNSDVIAYDNIINDVRPYIDDAIKCAKFLSKLKRYLFIQNIYILDKLGLEDILNEGHLSSLQIKNILKKQGYTEVDTDPAFEILMKKLPKNYENKINYKELAANIKSAADISLIDEIKIIRPEKLADPKKMLEDIAMTLVRRKIELKEMIENFDIHKERKVPSDVLESVLQSLKVVNSSLMEERKLAAEANSGNLSPEQNNHGMLASPTSAGQISLKKFLYNRFDYENLVSFYIVETRMEQRPSLVKAEEEKTPIFNSNEPSGNVSPRFPSHYMKPEANRPEIGKKIIKLADYQKFFSDLDEEIILYKDSHNLITGFAWADKILEDLAIDLYCKKESVVDYFAAYGINESNGSITREGFRRGIYEIKNVRLSEHELDRFMNNLDVNKDGLLQLYELNNIIEVVFPQAREHYERTLYLILEEEMKKKSYNLLDVMAKYDYKNDNMIQVEDFLNEIKNCFGGILEDKQILYLRRKYETVRENYINYSAMYNDILRSSYKRNFTQEQINLLDLLRNALRKSHLDLNIIFHEYDKAKKKHILPITVLRDIFSADIISEKDYDQLCLIVDPGSTKRFDYRQVLGLLWVGEEDPKNQEAMAIKLNKEIFMACRKRKEKLEDELVHLCKDRTGYLAPDDIKQGFMNCKIVLTYYQLSALLYAQPIATDASGRKNIADLINFIFNKNSVEEKLSQKKFKEEEFTDRENINRGNTQEDMINEAAKLLKAPGEKTDKPMLPPNIAESPLNVAGFPMAKTTDVFEEYRRYKVASLKQYRSINEDTLLRKITKYINRSSIKIMEHLQSGDLPCSGSLSIIQFFDILSKLGIELDPSEEQEVLQWPKVLEPTNDSVNYTAFCNLIVDEDYKILKEEGGAYRPKIAARTYWEGQKEKGQIGALAIRKEVTLNESAEKVKSRKIKRRTIPVEILPTMTPDDLKTAQEEIQRVKIEMCDKQLNPIEFFSRLDTWKTDAISFDDFVYSLQEDAEIIVDAKKYNLVYTLISPVNMNGLVSLKKLYNEMKLSQGNAQLKAETGMTCMERLAYYVQKNKIEKGVFINNSRNNSKHVTRADLEKIMKQIDFQYTLLDVDALFKEIDLNKNGVYGSLGHLLNNVFSKKPKLPIEGLEEQIKAIIKKVNSALPLVEKPKKITSIDTLYGLLDKNGDGYINEKEFVDGMVAILSVKITEEELKLLFAFLDINHNLTISINEIGLYILISSGDNGPQPIDIDQSISIEIDALYAKLDQDGDGKISEDELYMALRASTLGRTTHEDARELMKVLDLNKDGYLDREEYRIFMMNEIKKDILLYKDEMADLRMKFREYDIDGNGYLTKSEIMALLKDNYPRLSEEELNALFIEMDENKDQKIEIDEFINSLMADKCKALLIKTDSKQYRAVLSLKYNRRYSPNEYLEYFLKLSSSLIFSNSFMTDLQLNRKCLAADAFKLVREKDSYCGYKDIPRIMSEDCVPMKQLQEIKPWLAGYLFFKTIVGVPTANNEVLPSKSVINRMIKIGFYDTVKRDFVANSITVIAESSGGNEWYFNKLNAIGTNPVALKWTDKENFDNIKLVVELVLSIEKNKRIVDISNGFCEFDLKNFSSASDYILPLKAGSPQSPIPLEDAAKRAAHVLIDLPEKQKSQLILNFRPYNKLLAQKQKFINYLPSNCLIHKKLLPLAAMYRNYLSEVTISEYFKSGQLLAEDTICTAFTLAMNNIDVVNIMIKHWDIIFQKYRKNETQLKANFKNLIMRIYLSFKSKLFHYNYKDPVASLKGYGSIYDTRMKLLEDNLVGLMDESKLDAFYAEASKDKNEYIPFRIDELEI